MFSVEGNMNTWETLTEIHNRRKTREAELALEIEQERTRQAEEATKQSAHQFTYMKPDNVDFNQS